MGILGVNRYEIDGAKELLDLSLPGDWIMRTDSPVEGRLKALESIIRSDTGQVIHFERRPVEREVAVARGSYAFHSEPKAYDPMGVNIFADTLDTSQGAGGGSGTLTEFLQWTGNLILIPILNETKETAALQVTWRNNHSSHLDRIPAADRPAKIDMVLANLAKQTSLQFTRERRSIDVWFVTEQPASPPGKGPAAEPRAGV